MFAWVLWFEHFRPLWTAKKGKFPPILLLSLAFLFSNIIKVSSEDRLIFSSFEPFLGVWVVQFINTKWRGIEFYQRITPDVKLLFWSLREKLEKQMEIVAWWGKSSFRPKNVQLYPIVPICVQKCAKVFNCVWLSQTVFNCVQLCPSVSKSAQLCSTVSNCV